MRTVACADDWLVEIEALGVDPWARRTVIVGHPRVAHALRKELARGYRGDLLVGTCFLTLGQLAREILHRDGSSHGKIFRDAARPAHLRAVLERPLALAELDRAALVEDDGWDRACARAIADLDACDLLQAKDDLARDLVSLERSIDSAAESRAAL
ncbi:MAG: hypothetical protein K8H88_10415, partial [Sandaracinaceae bacterium]|nr:hypothetical protein [Sandaracinaceae bacterium]